MIVTGHLEATEDFSRYDISYILDSIQVAVEVYMIEVLPEGPQRTEPCPHYDMRYILDCVQAHEEVDDWSTPLEATENGTLSSVRQDIYP